MTNYGQTNVKLILLVIICLNVARGFLLFCSCVAAAKRHHKPLISSRFFWTCREWTGLGKNAACFTYSKIDLFFQTPFLRNDGAPYSCYSFIHYLKLFVLQCGMLSPTNSGKWRLTFRFVCPTWASRGSNSEVAPASAASTSVAPHVVHLIAAMRILNPEASLNLHDSTAVLPLLLLLLTVTITKYWY